jgi:hypothetical protein
MFDSHNKGTCAYSSIEYTNKSHELTNTTSQYQILEFNTYYMFDLAKRYINRSFFIAFVIGVGALLQADEAWTKTLKLGACMSKVSSYK